MKKLFSSLKNPRVLQAIVMLVLIALITGTYVYREKTRDRVSIENSIISAPVIALVPSLPGKLYELDAVEGHAVKTGDTLAVVGTETIRSQTDGIIIAANNQTGGTVGIQTPLIQMIRTQDMRVVGTIDENKGLNEIAVGQIASFTVDALPGQTFWGYVDEIAPSAKQTQISFSISSERPTQQFQVYARFNAGAYPQIKNGMSAKMTVYTADR